MGMRSASLSSSLLWGSYGSISWRWIRWCWGWSRGIFKKVIVGGAMAMSMGSVMFLRDAWCGARKINFWVLLNLLLKSSLVLSPSLTPWAYLLAQGRISFFGQDLSVLFFSPWGGCFRFIQSMWCSLSSDDSSPEHVNVTSVMLSELTQRRSFSVLVDLILDRNSSWMEPLR